MELQKIIDAADLAVSELAIPEWGVGGDDCLFGRPLGACDLVEIDRWRSEIEAAPEGRSLPPQHAVEFLVRVLSKTLEDGDGRRIFDCAQGLEFLHRQPLPLLQRIADPLLEASGLGPAEEAAAEKK